MPHYKFSDLAYNITDKKMPEPGDEKTYVGLEHLDSGSLAVTRWGGEIELKGQKLVMKKGDILFGRRNTYLRRAAIAPHDGIFSAHGMIFRPNTEVIDPDYFPFFIASDYFMNAAIRISVGSLSPTVNWKTLKELEFDIPTLEQQRKSAKILKAANELKESYQALLLKTDDLVKSQFIEMFGEGYEQGCIGDYIVELTGGKSLAGTEDCMNKVLCTGSVSYDYFIETEVKNLPLDYRPDERHLVCEGDILISRMNTLELVGAAAYVWKAPENTYIPDRIWKAKIKNNVNPIFVWQLLVHPTVKTEISKRAGGTSGSMKNISKEKLLSIPVPMIPQIEQNKFAIFAEQSDKSKFIGFKSQFVEMFGDPEINSRGLPIATLPDLGENLDSKRIPITGGNRKFGEYPYYGASGIVDYVADYIFDDDLLLISEDGANLVARVTPIAFPSKGKVWINNHAHVIKFKSMAMQCYVENLLNMLDISQYVTGTAQPKLNQAKLNSIPIPVPEEEEIKMYLAFVKQSDKSKLKKERKKNE